MRIVLKSRYIEACGWAAGYIADRIVQFNPQKNKPFILGLPTGSTPLGIYRELIQKFQQNQLSFQHVITFNMDEYLGLEETHPQSYHYFMWENFFKHIDIPRENVNILQGKAPDPEKECALYEKKIAACGGIHLFLGGIGGNGHVAFNEPGSSFQSRTRLVDLTRETIQDNARFFEGDLLQVPSKALSVGIGTIMEAKEVLLVATGKTKAEAAVKITEGPVTELVPASALQLHPGGIFIMDREAATGLSEDSLRKAEQ